MLSEISQTDKNKYCVYHLYTESKKIQQTSECNIKKKRNRLTDIENKLWLWVGRWQNRGGGVGDTNYRVYLGDSRGQISLMCCSPGVTKSQAWCAAVRGSQRVRPDLVLAQQ